MRRTILGAMVLCVAMSGCSKADPEAATDANRLGTARPFGEIMVESQVGGEGASVSRKGVTVTVAPNTTKAELLLRIARPGDMGEHRLLGHPVEIKHEEPLHEPVLVSLGRGDRLPANVVPLRLHGYGRT